MEKETINYSFCNCDKYSSYMNMPTGYSFPPILNMK